MDDMTVTRRAEGIPIKVQRASAIGELRSGWKTLAGACLGVGIGFAPYPIYLIPFIALQLEEQFVWTRVQTSSLSSMALLGGAIGLPLAGWLMDRWGEKRLALLSTVAIMILLALAAFAPGDALVWQIGCFALGILGAGSYTTYSKAVCLEFFAIRGLALGLIAGCSSLFSIVLLPVLDRVIAAVGTSNTFLVAAAAYLFVFVPALLFLLPWRAASVGAGAAPRPSSTFGDAQASTFTLVLFAGSALLMIMAASGTGAHLVALASDGGVSAPALIGSVLAFGSLIVRPATGFLIDRFNAARIGALAFGLSGIGIAMVGVFGAPAALPGALLIAVGVGAEVDLVTYLASRYLPPSRYGSYIGWIFGGMMLLSSLAIVAVSLLREQFGGYRVPFLCAAVLAAAAAALMLALPSYKDPSNLIPDA